MPIAACPSCRSNLRVADDAAGKAVRCPKCAKVFRTSGPAALKAAPAERPSPTPPKRDLSEEPVLGEGDLEVVEEEPPDTGVEELDEVEDEEGWDEEAERAGDRPRNRRLVKNIVDRDLRIEQDVPEPLRQQISEELSESERLIWVGQPNERLMMIRGLAGTAIGAVMFLSFLIHLFGVATGIFEGGKDWRGWPLVLLIQAPFYLFSVSLILTPLWRRWQATRTCYALTNRRAIVWSCAWHGALRVHSSSPGDLTDVRRADSWIYGRGAGDLTFHGGRFSAQTMAHGFLAIDDVRDVEQLMHDTLIDR